ncbi:unnamed protein product [Pleuronectes platessa]|uniref:Uncharacterized protein n=1 Tax=Pleuronectes platessa TaxID=8262 RepID=A0A9N7TZ21_PLEPL|nr:unnamed protein product [Pleuronectes platessa]
MWKPQHDRAQQEQALTQPISVTTTSCRFTQMCHTRTGTRTPYTAPAVPSAIWNQSGEMVDAICLESERNRLDLAKEVKTPVWVHRDRWSELAFFFNRRLHSSIQSKEPSTSELGVASPSPNLTLKFCPLRQYHRPPAGHR